LRVVIRLVFKLGAHMATYKIPLLMSNLGFGQLRVAVLF